MQLLAFSNTPKVANETVEMTSPLGHLSTAGEPSAAKAQTLASAAATLKTLKDKIALIPAREKSGLS